MDYDNIYINWNKPITGNWDNPNNWDLKRIPNRNDTVSISVPGIKFNIFFI